MRSVVTLVLMSAVAGCSSVSESEARILDFPPSVQTGGTFSTMIFELQSQVAPFYDVRIAQIHGHWALLEHRGGRTWADLRRLSTFDVVPITGAKGPD